MYISATYDPAAAAAAAGAEGGEGGGEEAAAAEDAGAADTALAEVNETIEYGDFDFDFDDPEYDSKPWFIILMVGISLVIVITIYCLLKKNSEKYSAAEEKERRERHLKR